MNEELLKRVKDFIEMELRSCSMQVFTQYIARNMQISHEDAKEALSLLKMYEVSESILAIVKLSFLVTMLEEETII